MLNSFPSASFRQITEELFAATKRLCEASKESLPLEEVEELVAEVENATYRCRRALNSARFLEKTDPANRSAGA